MNIYRIYTEEVPGTVELVSRYLNNFTVFRGTGYYQSSQENSIIIEHIGQDMLGVIHEIAREIARVNNQQAVLVSSQPISAELISEATTEIL